MGRFSDMQLVRPLNRARKKLNSTTRYIQAAMLFMRVSETVIYRTVSVGHKLRACTVRDRIRPVYDDVLRCGTVIRRLPTSPFIELTHYTDEKNIRLVAYDIHHNLIRADIRTDNFPYFRILIIRWAASNIFNTQAFKKFMNGIGFRITHDPEQVE